MRGLFSPPFTAAVLVIICMVWDSRAATLSGFVNQKDLTPSKLARAIADFTFELAPQVQDPDAFLQRKRGDCADFANLASIVLAQHGYSTQLIVVMMDQQTHVVCYVKEAGGFLDYNHRADEFPVVLSDGSLEDVARHVAGDFRSGWRMASAFRYRNGSPVYGHMVFAPQKSAAVASQRSARKRF